MVKTWPVERKPGTAIVRISDPAMEWHEIDLNQLLKCCRRELARRQFVFKKKVAEGSISEAKAQEEIDGMRAVVEFLVHCVFKAVTRRSESTQ